MHVAWRPTSAGLAESLAAGVRAPLTYSATGADAPPGYVALQQAAMVGTGRSGWARLAAALLNWDLHRTAGMVLASDAAAVELGATIVNAAPLGPVALLAPCRVVALVEKSRRRGFAYATLPGHPLRGREEFTVELDEQMRIWLRIRSVSRPCGLARLSPRLARAGQRLINRRYLRAAGVLAR